MEFKVIRETAATSEVACDALTELPIEYDMLLPDYCPDVMKILKCCGQTVFTSSEVTGSTLNVEGHVLLNLYYLTEAMQMRCCEAKSPFSKAVDLKCTPENPSTSLSGQMEYINCRALSPRRVDIRGAATISAKVVAQKSEELVTDASGGGIQLRHEEMETTRLVGAGERQFTVREELELPQEKAPVGVIVRRSACATVTDCKVIAGKAILKGDLSMELFYLSSEDETPNSMQYTLPISQIVDIAEVDEDCICDTRLQVLSTDIQPKADLDGEAKLFSAEITLCAVARAYRTQSVRAVEDAYSTAAQTTFTQRPMTALRLVCAVSGEHAYREQLELPEEVSDVLYMWCEAAYTGCRTEEATAKLGVRLCVCMLALDKDKTPVYFEKPVELEHTIDRNESGTEGIYADVLAQAGTCDFTMTSGGVEVRCPIRMQGMLLCARRRTVMGDLSVDEKKPLERDAAALTIYFAQGGECVWDIAKRYQTSVTAVMEENAIEHESLPGRVTLLIPLI